MTLRNVFMCFKIQIHMNWHFHHNDHSFKKSLTSCINFLMLSNMLLQIKKLKTIPFISSHCCRSEVLMAQLSFCTVSKGHRHMSSRIGSYPCTLEVSHCSHLLFIVWKMPAFLGMWSPLSSKPSMTCPCL